MCLFFVNKDKGDFEKENPSSSTNTNKNVSLESPESIRDKEVEKLLNSLTLEEKIGQMLFISYETYSLDDHLKEIVETYKPGGFALEKANFNTYEELVTLIDDLQSLADIPMFIGTDQEGGTVQRLKYLKDVNASEIPSMEDLGNTEDVDLAYDLGKVLAEELLAVGINMDFAPCLDVVDKKTAYIGSRSFGDDPALVTKMGESLAKGLLDNHVIPVYKHFPGHGATTVNSHYDLPVIYKSKEELYEKDLIPFQEAVKDGAEIIMVGHLALPNVVPDNTPASLSKEVITGILREEMGYDGIVITDALNMGAITKNYTEKEIYELAINAGVDILLMPKNVDKAVEYIKESIEEGTITEEQINQSVRRILTLKSKYLPVQKLPKEQLGSDSHLSVIRQILGE